MEFTTGIKDIDELYPKLLRRGFLIVVAGPPGSGKTSLASLICSRNASKGKKCLYISFQEDKEKYFSLMSTLGINLLKLEEEGLFNYLKLPMTKDIEYLVDEISKIVMEYSPSIVVVDSVNAILQYVRDEDKRAWLQNFFSQLPQLIGGIVILVAEHKPGAHILGLGDIEFIADVLFFLEHKLRRGLLSRVLQVRKARGTRIHVSEIPFTIREGIGIQVLAPEVIQRIRSVPRFYRGKSTLFNRSLGYIQAGEHILVLYPAYARMQWYLLPIIEIVVLNDLRVLGISYHYSPDEMKFLIKRFLVNELGLSEDAANRIIDRHFILEALNPYSYSLEELALEEKGLFDAHKPNVVAFHAVELLDPLVESDRALYYNLLVNQIYSFKRHGVIMLRIMGVLSRERVLREVSLADVVVRVMLHRNNIDSPRIYFWRRGARPTIVVLDENTVEMVRSELRSILTEGVNKSV